MRKMNNQLSVHTHTSTRIAAETDPLSSSSLKENPRNSMFYFMPVMGLLSVFVGPCHHGMARPQVADGGTASDMDGSCE